MSVLVALLLVGAIVVGVLVLLELRRFVMVPARVADEVVRLRVQLDELTGRAAEDAEDAW